MYHYLLQYLRGLAGVCDREEDVDNTRIGHGRLKRL